LVFARGLTYYRKNDHDRAIADYSEAIRLDPDYIGAYRSRGYANVYVANYGGAASDLARVVQR
jgi:tetratricopeptide (TPR) repeat protein